MSADSLAALFRADAVVEGSNQGLLEQMVTGVGGRYGRCNCYLCKASRILSAEGKNLDGNNDTPWLFIPDNNDANSRPAGKRVDFAASTAAFTSSNTLDSIAGLNSPYISGLMTGGQWGTGNPDNDVITNLHYYFYTDGEESYLSQFGEGSSYLSVDWSADEKSAILQAMQDYSDVANITFTETANKDEANVRWSNYQGSSPNSFGAAFPPLGDHQAYGDIESNYTAYAAHSDSEALSPGSFYYLTLTHELGHAIGFKHPHSQDERNGVQFDTFPGVTPGGESQGGDNDLNGTPFTVMTYNDQTSQLKSTAPDGNDYFVSPRQQSTSGYLTNLGAFDIAATQYLYGVNETTNSGNNTYVLDDGLAGGLSGYTTIWDNGGIDEITAEDSARGAVIDLRNATLKNEKGGGGFLSRVFDEFAGFLIAYNTTGTAVIENATGSDHDDKITGNDGDNTIVGGDGDDTIIAGLGSDDIHPGDGADSIVFTEGASLDAVHDFDVSKDKVIIPEGVSAEVLINGSTDLIIRTSETNQMALLALEPLFVDENLDSYSFIVGGTSGYDDYDEEEEEVESSEFTEIATNKGATKLWESGDGRVWYGPEATRKPIKDDATNDAYYLYEDWGYGYRKAHSLITDGSNFWLVLEEKYSSDSEDADEDGFAYSFEAVRVKGADSTLDWGNSFRGDDIKEIEVFVNKNLEDDNTDIGYTESDLDLTWKDNEDDAADNGDTKLGTDSEGYLYISNDTAGLLKIKDEWGGDVRLDEQDDYSESGWKRVAVQATKDEDSSSDTYGQYLIAVQETWTNTWGDEGPTEESQWMIYPVSPQGEMSWENTLWNVNIASYEDDLQFGYDLNDDGDKGINFGKLETIDTDTTGAKPARLGDSIYVVDGSNKLVTDTYGYAPDFEFSDSWEGGSYSATVYAVEATEDGYALAIKHTEEFDDDFFGDGDEPPVTNPPGDPSGKDGDDQTVYWEIINLNADAKLDWDNGNIYTESIAGYEKVFNQDLNGDESIGVNITSLASVETDVVADQLKVSNEGTLHIWDGVDTNTVVDVEDANGGSPSFVVNETWEEGYFKITPYAVTKISGGSDPDYYRVAIKFEESYSFDGVENTRAEWELYKVSLAGIIDPEATVFTPSITTWEDEFGHDMNGDNDFSGNIAITERSTDTKGVKLGDADGQLFIVDGGTNIGINDSWIEENNSWGDGYFRSTALAVEKNDYGTASTSDDRYQVAVKQENKWTDWEGNAEIYQNWQVYAVKADGSIDWEKTIWTESIVGFETFFDQDLDGDNATGVNTANLTTASKDKFGYLLKKDTKNLLYITDSDGENLISITDEYGGYPTFDYSHSWGSGSHVSEAVAVEQTSSGFSMAVKHVDTFDGRSSTFWEILKLNANGVLSWSDSIWTDDIAVYETSPFKDDLDGDGATGLNLSGLVEVEGTGDEKLKKDANNNFYIEASSNVLKIAYPWGGSPDYQVSESWGEGYSFSREAVAVADKSFADSELTGVTHNGYVVAIKNTFTDGSETHIDWQLDYVKPDGVIDEGKTEHKFSIKNDETTFGMDLDGGGIGLDVSKLDAVTTDTTGDVLKKDGYAYYIIDDNNSSLTVDDVTIPLVDVWGDSPYFDYNWSYGSGDNKYSEDVATFAVESFTENGEKKFLLAIKRQEQYGSETAETFWETFKITESSEGAGDWSLDWSTGSHTKGVRRLESTLNMDLNGNNVIDSGTVTTTNVSTDTSSSGLTGVSLALDSEGLMYIKKGSSQIEIRDANGSITFDYKESWGGYSYEAAAYAVEGVANKDNDAIASYVLAVKVIETDLGATSNNQTTSWMTFSVDSTGLLDWSSETWSDAPKQYEASLNQDLDADGGIWSIAKETLSEVETDTRGAKLFTDPTNFLYVQAAGSATKSPLLDQSGDPLLLHYSFKDGDYSTSETPIAVDAIDVDGKTGNDAYRILIRNQESQGDATFTSYSTVNADITTLKADWTTYGFYESANAMEDAFKMDLDGNGSVYEIKSSNATEVATDTTGAKLRTQDGTLFIKDGDTTMSVVGAKDGAPVMLNISETDSELGLSYTSAPIAVQKVSGGTTYKLVTKETFTVTADGSTTTNISYVVYDVSATGALDRSSATYRTAAELNESVFGQDITGDGTVSQGSSTDTYKDNISTTVSQEVKDQYQSQASSDMVAVTTSIADSGAGSGNSRNSNAQQTLAELTAFVSKTGANSAANSALSIKQIQSADSALLKKAEKDASLSAANKTLESITGVLDFSVTVTDASQHGKIQSVAWVLPGTFTDTPIYLKKDKATGEFFNFAYDSATGEGARWDAASKTMTVYVRDNGKYDWDDTNGVTRDPGFFAYQSSSSSPSPSPTPSPSPSPSPTPSATPTATPDSTPTTTPAPTPTPTPTPTSTPAAIDELPADVSDLGAGDIATLTSDAVSELTADQVGDLPPAAMQGFTADQVSELSEDAVAAFTPKQVKQLSPDAVAGLSKSQVSELTPKAMKGFTSEQVEQMPKRAFKALESDQLSKLSKDAVTGLTSGQLKTLTAEDITAFKPGKIKSLDVDAMSGFKPSTLDEFSNRQVKALTDDQLAGLSKKQIKKADDFVDALSDQQREALSFDPGRSSRLVDPLSDQDDLSLLPGLDPLA